MRRWIGLGCVERGFGRRIEEEQVWERGRLRWDLQLQRSSRGRWVKRGVEQRGGIKKGLSCLRASRSHSSHHTRRVTTREQVTIGVQWEGDGG